MSTKASDQEDQADLSPRTPARLRSPQVKGTAAIAVFIGLAVLVAGCGGASSPGVVGPGTNTGNDRSGPGSPGNVMGRAVAYARCMRSHGLPDFPDPAANPGGGVGFQINAGPGSDLNPNAPTFKAAHQACQSLLPSEGQPRQASPEKLAAEVKWAQCMRSHGLPAFPDPDADGAFDSSRFDPNSPAFQTASNSCKAVEPAGPITAVPGHGPP